MSKFTLTMQLLGAAVIWAILTFVGYAWIAMGTAQSTVPDQGQKALYILIMFSVATYLAYVWRSFKKLDR